jgi:hypothetical protein
VFRAVSQHIGPAVKRVPDGETGERSGWTVWQDQVMAKSPDVERAGSRDLHGIAYPTYAPKPGIAPERMEFGELGYAKAAKESYLVFRVYLARNQFARALQVSLPTPLAVVQASSGAGGCPRYLESTRAAAAEGVDEIVRFIPDRELAFSGYRGRVSGFGSSRIRSRTAISNRHVDEAIARISDQCRGTSNRLHF